MKIIKNYKANKDDVMSWYILSDEDFDEQEAFEALTDDVPEVRFIEFDLSVAQFHNYNYCAIFHELK